MKVEIFAEIDTTGCSDSEKVFLGLLTFLHLKYPDENLFRLYTTDLRVILNKRSTGNIAIPDVVVHGSLGYGAQVYGLGEIEHRDAIKQYSIKASNACTVQGYLLALYRTREDWTDYENPGTFIKRRGANIESMNSKFSPTESEIYFKTKEVHSKQYKRSGGRPKKEI